MQTQQTNLGFLARPDGAGPFPAVVLIQEWWGLNDHIKDIAGRFASAGFLTLAPDLYDGKVTKDPNEAGRLMQALDQKVALSKLNASVDFLKKHSASKGNVGAVGFCMGGSLALLLPCQNSDVRASVPFYGKVPDESVLQALACPVTYIYAGRDQWVTRDEPDRLEAALKKFNKPGQVARYPNADHAFFNDTRKEVFKADDAADAWKRAVTFLTANL